MQHLKTFGDALSCRVTGQNFNIILSREIFVTSAGDLKLSSKCCQQFKCLSWKIFRPVQVNLPQAVIIYSLPVQLHVQIII